MMQFPQNRWKRYSLLTLVLLFFLAGINHFVNPASYLPLMPSYFPSKVGLVYWSGVFEVLGALGLLLPQTRTLAGWGLVLMLVAFLPVHVHMALHPGQYPSIPTWALYLRIPLQFVLMWWIYRAVQPDAAQPQAASS